MGLEHVASSTGGWTLANDEESAMSLLDAPDRESQLIRLILMILGAFLLVVGWTRWARLDIF